MLKLVCCSSHGACLPTAYVEQSSSNAGTGCTDAVSSCDRLHAAAVALQTEDSRHVLWAGMRLPPQQQSSATRRTDVRMQEAGVTEAEVTTPAHWVKGVLENGNDYWWLYDPTTDEDDDAEVALEQPPDACTSVAPEPRPIFAAHHHGC